MSLAKTLRGTKLLIKVSDMDPDTPVFAHPCLINTSRGIQFTAEMNEVLVPDCSDPDLMAWLEREKKSLSAAINGAGVLNSPDTEEYFEWVTDADPRDVKVELAGVVLADGGGSFGGKFHLASFELAGDRGDKVNCTLSLQSTGAVAWTAAAA
jgi:predicted secreted protein